MSSVTATRYGFGMTRGQKHHLTRTMKFSGRALCGVGYAGVLASPIAGYRLCRKCQKIERLDNLTRALTAFQSFPRLLRADGGFCPTLRGFGASELAMAYDAAQAGRGDPRRAFRG